MSPASLAELKLYLKDVPSGKLADAVHVERLLATAWDDVEVQTSDANLDGYKLVGRTEGLSWQPPFLTFDIERHGATVNGSTYAHVYSWQVDVEHGTARMAECPRRRTVGDRAKTVKVQPIAEEIAGLILRHEPDARLIWKAAQLVRLNIGGIIPATNQQTTSARRRRFKTALESELAPHGWKRTGVNTFTAVH